MNLRARSLVSAAKPYIADLASMLWEQAVKFTFEPGLSDALPAEAVDAFHEDVEETGTYPQEAAEATRQALVYADDCLDGKAMSLVRRWARDGYLGEPLWVYNTANTEENRDISVFWFFILLTFSRMDDIVLFQYESAPNEMWTDVAAIDGEFDLGPLEDAVMREAELYLDE